MYNLNQNAWDSVRQAVGPGLLSVLMPAFNLEKVIADNVRRVQSLFAGQVPFEIIVINDGSRDQTADELHRLQAEIPELRPLLLPRNVGKGSALRAGFEVSRGTHIVFLDADLDLPPGQIPEFFRIMNDQRVDVVIGSKQHPDSQLSYPWQRRIMSAIYYRCVKLLFGLPVRDTQTGLKLFTRSSLQWAFPRILVKAFAFDLELLALIHQQGFKIAEAPVTVDFQGKGGFVAPRMIRNIVVDTLAVFYRLQLLKYYQSIPDIHMPSPPPLASILIACPSATPFLDEIVAALADQSYSNYEVLLLPDAPTGRTWPERWREIPTGKIRPAEKRNLGIAAARGSITVFLDDDAFPVPEWLQRGLEYFCLPDVVAVGGPAVTPHQDPWLARLGGRVYESRLVSGNYRYRYQADRVRDVDDFPSCNFFVRTDALRQLHGFRTDFWPGEDTFLCMELTHTLGFRILYEPRAMVAHHRRKLFLPHLRQIGRYALHRGYFARRFPQTSRRLSYFMPSFFSVGVVAGALLALLVPPLRPLYFMALALYTLIVLLFTFSRSPLNWVLIALGVILTHLWYGTRFLIGFLTRRLPGEVRPFDHPSERPSPAVPPSAGAPPL
jgi:glycosyltransferase involved in cell wall biosynthesis